MQQRNSRKMQHDSIILIGPTGSGKTPLGELLETSGLNNKRIAHFDFGDHLRKIISGKSDFYFNSDDADFLRKTVEQGLLLENETFYLAQRILDGFVASRKPFDTILMNGLPRHLGQARDLEATLNITGIIHLKCTAETVMARIYENTGGDRTHRKDDRAALVRQKLATFDERTAPLLNYYRQQGNKVATIEVETDTKPSQLLSEIERLLF